VTDHPPAGLRHLTQTGFWNLLTPAQQRLLWTSGSRHDHPAGTVLLHEGAPAGSALILLTGRVKVMAVGASGYQCLLSIQVAGDVIGELSAIDRKPRSATVIAVDPVHVLRLPADDLESLLGAHPGIALALLKVVATRLRAANLRLVELGETTVAERVVLTLTRLAAEHGMIAETGITLTLPFGQDDLAGMVVGSREAVVRALRVLRDEGTISTGRRRITILEPATLGQRVPRPA
jgi:CRP/FNR family cyclic AMP-dependent transcriptional regulator